MKDRNLWSGDGLIAQATLSQKLLIPIALIALLLMIGFGYFSYQRALNEAREQSRLIAEAVQRQVEADRVYYTGNVVAKALEAGLDVTDQHHNSEQLAIPLPATYVREVSEGLNETATSTEYELSLLSLFPVNPNQGARNEAERAFMEINFKQNINQENLDTINGQTFFTFYTPDVANTQACVTCHNNLSESPKTDYELGDVMGSLVIRVPMEERLNQLTFDTLLQIGLFGFILVAAGFVYYPLSQRTFLHPIRRLAVAASEFAQGNRAVQLEASSQDEVGQLVHAFNDMTTQLNQTIDTLNDRSRQLELVVDINQRLATILEVDELLHQVVTLTKETFGYYHVHIYLMDETNKTLVMQKGYGQIGEEMKAQKHSIPLNALTSFVARAARSGEPVRVDNVRLATDWLPSPLLPDTYAEIAVPIILDGEAVGVLDVQVDKIAGLDESDENLLRSLANQVAIAIRNTRFFSEVETQLFEARATQEQYLTQSWDKTNVARQQSRYVYTRPDASPLDETKQQIFKEMQQQISTQEQPTILPHNGDVETKSLVAPVKLGRNSIGAVQLHNIEIHNLAEDDLAILEAVLDQLAQTAENLRLFDETRQQASQEQTIREITDKLRASPNIDVLLETAARELGQRLQVRHTVFELGLEQSTTSKNTPENNGKPTQ